MKSADASFINFTQKTTVVGGGFFFCGESVRGVTVVKRLLLVCGPSEPFSYSRCSCLQKGVFPVVEGEFIVMVTCMCTCACTLS